MGWFYLICIAILGCVIVWSQLMRITNEFVKELGSKPWFLLSMYIVLQLLHNSCNQIIKIGGFPFDTNALWLFWISQDAILDDNGMC